MKSTLRMILFLFLGVLLISTAQAADEQPTLDELQEGAERAQLGHALITYGREQRSALAILNGIEILSRVPAQVLERGEEPPNGRALERSELFAEAREFAGDHAELLELIADAEADRDRQWVYYPRCEYYYYCGYYSCWWRYYCN